MYKIIKPDGTRTILDGDGFYLTPKGDLNIYQSSAEMEMEDIADLGVGQEQLPTVNVVTASFAAGNWTSIYQIEDERMEH